jgi:hypothetical protein
MSVNGVSAGSNAGLGAVQGVVNQWKQGLSQIQSSLQSGDIAAAQKAYQSLVKLHETNAPYRQGGGNPTLTADFQALGEALKGGDVNNAQNVFDHFHTDLAAAKQAWQASHGQPPSTPPPTTPPTPAPSEGSTFSIYA